MNLATMRGRIDILQNNALIDGTNKAKRGTRFERPRNQDYRLSPEQLAHLREHGNSLLGERVAEQADYRPFNTMRTVNDPLIGEKLIVKVSAASKWDGSAFCLPVPKADQLREQGAFKLAALVSRIQS